MSHSPAALPPVAPPISERLATYVRRIPQRFGERDFWITQAVLLGVTTLHVLMELWLHRGGGNAPTALYNMPVVLYLAPIAYATLRYGMEGAVLTGLWSGVLMLPNILIWHREDLQWLEIVYVALVIGMGIVMSLPVEQERVQRQRAETTIQRQVLLGDIAALTLTADLDTTLAQTLRRLSEALGFETACVAVVTQSSSAGSEISVIATHPVGGDGTDTLMAALHRYRPADGSGSTTHEGEDIVVVPLSADVPEQGTDAGVDGVLNTPDDRSSVKVAATGVELRLGDGSTDFVVVKNAVARSVVRLAIVSLHAAYNW